MVEVTKTIVLFVDDEPPFRRIYRDILERNHFHFLEASNGDNAWRLLQTQKPDVVILDIILPGMLGMELLQRIREDERFKNIPVIMLTVVNDHDEAKECIELGADYYAVKGSFAPVEILGMIRSAIRKRHGQVQGFSKVIRKGKRGRPEVHPNGVHHHEEKESKKKPSK